MKDQTDRPNRYLKRREAERFWQFQFERDPIKETETFYDKDHGSKELSLAAARKYRDEFFKAAADIGVIDASGQFYIRPLPIQTVPSLRNKSGIVGVSRDARFNKSKSSFEKVWIANYKNDEGENEQKSFTIIGLGEKQALIAAIRFRLTYVRKVLGQLNFAPHKEQVQAHIEELEFLCEYIETLVEDNELFYFLSTLNNPSLTATEKYDFIATRIGQERFRRFVLARWGDCCAVTGATIFLTAGHIKPWSESDDKERLDPNNGLALSPVFDKAFDAGLITFETNGSIRISRRLLRDMQALGISGQERIEGLSVQNEAYLLYHRAHRYRS